MAVWRDLLGTVGQFLRIGRTGPRLKNSSGALDVRTPTDSAYAVVRAATPVAANDVDIKSRTDGAIRCVKATAGTSTAYSTTSIPTNARVMRAELEITTAYSVGAIIALGYINDANALLSTTNISNSQGLTMYGKNIDHVWPTAAAVQIFISGAPATGACTAKVYYAITAEV